MADETLVQVAIPPLAGEFTYSVPLELASTVGPGSLVDIQLGKRITRGIVVRPASSAQTGAIDYVVKPIRSVARRYPLLRSSQLPWLEWVSHYYQESLSSVLDTAIPPMVPEKKGIVGDWTDGS